jgi:D-methionine transport system substrate-binding protein
MSVVFKQSRRIFTLTGLSLLLCASAVQAQETLTIAANPVPHAEILEFVKPLLAKQGVTLKIKVFTDYIQPGVQVNEKRLDGNYYLTQPYLNEFKKRHRAQHIYDKR